MRKRRKLRVPRVCHWCRRQLTGSMSGASTAFTRDHVIPKAHGGETTVPCCLACNNLKGDMTPAEWLSFCERNPRWWELWKGRRRVNA